MGPVRGVGWGGGTPVTLYSARHEVCAFSTESEELKLGTHNPCPRAVFNGCVHGPGTRVSKMTPDASISNTAREHGCHFGHPCSRAVDTAREHVNGWCVPKGKERKEEYLYSAFSHQGTYKALRHGSHSFTCKQHHACISFVAFTRCHHHSN